MGAFAWVLVVIYAVMFCLICYVGDRDPYDAEGNYISPWTRLAFALLWPVLLVIAAYYEIRGW